jgi:hypothetical protein
MIVSFTKGFYSGNTLFHFHWSTPPVANLTLTTKSCARFWLHGIERAITILDTGGTNSLTVGVEGESEFSDGEFWLTKTDANLRLATGERITAPQKFIF